MSIKEAMRGTTSMKDAMREFADQIAAMERDVMTVVLEATEKLARLTNCRSFLMFEAKGRRFFCGSPDLCDLYSRKGLESGVSDERISGNSFPKSMNEEYGSDSSREEVSADDKKPTTSVSDIQEDETEPTVTAYESKDSKERK